MTRFEVYFNLSMAREMTGKTITSNLNKALGTATVHYRVGGARASAVTDFDASEPKASLAARLIDQDMRKPLYKTVTSSSYQLSYHFYLLIAR